MLAIPMTPIVVAELYLASIISTVHQISYVTDSTIPAMMFAMKNLAERMQFVSLKIIRRNVNVLQGTKPTLSLKSNVYQVEFAVLTHAIHLQSVSHQACQVTSASVLQV